MKYRGIFAIILAFFCVSANAQKINRAYLSKVVEGGHLYFIMPLDKIFGEGKYNSITMDFTHTSPSEEVRINYTYLQPIFSPADSIELCTSGKSKIFKAEKIYVEPAKKSYWTHRYGSQLTKDDVRVFFSGELPSSMFIYSNGKKIEYRTSGNQKWKNKINIINSVFDIIENNK